nr:MAG TPA: hypothetical protein [Caudoviricetes sp.]
MDKFQESENEGRRIFESLLKQSRTAKTGIQLLTDMIL